MLSVTFLWIFSRGIELGVIVLCLLPIRALLRKRIPRVFSYLLWAALPVNLVCNIILGFLIKQGKWIMDHVYRSPRIMVDESIIRALESFWICGTVLVACVMIVSYIRFRVRLVGSIRVDKGVYLSARIGAPFTLGVFSPKIYLPSSLPEEYYEAVILHEKVHIVRKDVWMKYLGIAVVGLFWFQPVLWFAYRKFVNDMEAACDEAVLRQKGETYCQEYARTLVEVSCLEGSTPRVAIGYGNGEIKERVKNVMKFEHTKHSLRIKALVVCVFFIVLSIPLSWQVPRLVRAEEQEHIFSNEVFVEKTGIDKKKTTIE